MVLDGALNLAQARTGRAHYARLAELHAYRYQHARAEHRYTLATRSERQYRRSARRCRLLGDFIRMESSFARSRDFDKGNAPVAELVAAVRGL